MTQYQCMSSSFRLVSIKVHWKQVGNVFLKMVSQFFLYFVPHFPIHVSLHAFKFSPVQAITSAYIHDNIVLMLNIYHNLKIVYDIGTKWSKNTLVHTLQPIDLNRQNCTAAIYYMLAKLGDFILKDVDILPLQGWSWQTNVVCQ